MAIERIRILGVASGGGAGKPGAQDGPTKLRDLGLITRLQNAGFEVSDLGDVPGGHETEYDGEGEASRNVPEVLQVNRHTYAAVRNAWRDATAKDFVLIIGGDHSLAIGTLGGITDSCKRLGILWIDAHADFNTPYSSPSGNIHGMSLAIACGRGHREFRAIAEYDPMVEDQDVFLFGCRDIDPGEKENLTDSDVHLFEMPQWRAAGVVSSVVDAARLLATRCDHVHLSFDIDVVDAEHVPGTGTRVAGGLSVDEACALLRELGGLRVLKSAEVVEYNPHIDAADKRTGKLTCDLIAALMEGMR